jgi:anti-anti-sigma factor
MGVRTLREGATTTVAYGGELDVLTSPALEQALEEAIDGDGEAIVLDLRDLRFLDSSGVRSILRGRTRARAAGKSFELLRPGGYAKRALDVSGVG